MIRMGGNKVRVQCIWTVLPMNQCFCTGNFSNLDKYPLKMFEKWVGFG